MIKKILFSSVFLFTVVLLTGCSDDPNSVGAGVIPDQVQILQINSQSDSVIQSSATFTKIISLGGAGGILVGAANGVESYAMLRFNMAASKYFEDLKNDSLEVVSAVLYLTPTYKTGDTSSRVQFSVHNLLNDWTGSTFTADSVVNLRYNQQNEIINNSLSASDTLYTCSVSPYLITEWMSSLLDTPTGINNGIILRALPGSTTITGFNSQNIGDIETSPYIKTVLKKGTTYTDTVVFPVLEDVHFLTGSFAPLPDGRIDIVSGKIQYGRISFDLSALPANAAINRAQLYLYKDSITSVLGTVYNDYPYVFFTSDSVENIYEGSTSAQMIPDSAGFSAEVTNIVTRMFFQKTNYGFTIASGSSLEGVDRLVIFSSTSINANLRPKLVISYSIPR